MNIEMKKSVMKCLGIGKLIVTQIVSRLKLLKRRVFSITFLVSLLILGSFFVLLSKSMDLQSHKLQSPARISSSLFKHLNQSNDEAVDFSIAKQLQLLPKDDVTTLIDFESFQFLTNPKSCMELKKQPEIVIMIVSRVNASDIRQTIRQTWGSYDPRSYVLFLIGIDDNEENQGKIEKEFKVKNSR
jgi:hypothetical protein